MESILRLTFLSKSKVIAKREWVINWWNTETLSEILLTVVTGRLLVIGRRASISRLSWDGATTDLEDVLYRLTGGIGWKSDGWTRRTLWCVTWLENQSKSDASLVLTESLLQLTASMLSTDEWSIQLSRQFFYFILIFLWGYIRGLIILYCLLFCLISFHFASSLPLFHSILNTFSSSIRQTFQAMTLGPYTWRDSSVKVKLNSGFNRQLQRCFRSIMQV